MINQDRSDINVRQMTARGVAILVKNNLEFAHKT